MKRRVGWLLFVVVILLGVIPQPRLSAATPACSLCILEVGAIGIHGEQDQDFVIVTNVTSASITSTGIQLRYYNAAGILDSTLGIGTFTAGQTKVYASDSLRTVNAAATQLPIALSNDAGKLQIARSTSTTTTLYDQVAWGGAVGGEGLAASTIQPGTTLARYNTAGIVVDTNQNSFDFELRNVPCNGVAFSEIQPFVTDVNGSTITAWLELSGSAAHFGDCQLITAEGDSYTIPNEVLPNADELAVIEEGIVGNNTVPIHVGEGVRHVWLVGLSVYGSVNLPLTDQSFSSLTKGQSWAEVDGVWRGTYALSPGEENVYQANPTALNDDSQPCHSVRITEVLPNPNGADTGHEWLELYNEATEPVHLASCIITIADDTYYFLPEDALAADEWQAFYSLRDENGDEQSVTLRNSDGTLVSLLGLHSNSVQDVIQSFVYSNAPEGQAWARFDDGWRWVLPTPGQPNTVAVSGAEQEPTEQAAATDSPSLVYVAPAQPLQITELLPNPAAPEADETDEFIELFNPNDEAVSLAGFKLQTGTSYSHSYTFTDQTIAPRSYVVFKSDLTHVSLSNSSGRARLLDPLGNTMAETDIYTDAPEGQSWVLNDGIWQWSGTPTAGDINKVTIPILTSALKTVKKTAAAKPKTSNAKAPAVKAAKTTTKAKDDKAKPAATQAAKTSAPPIHPLVLAGVGGLALAYAGYEYRQDMRNKFLQFRANRAARKATRR